MNRRIKLISVLLLIIGFSFNFHLGKSNNEQDIKLANLAALNTANAEGVSHTLECDTSLKVCRATCDIHQVTLTSQGKPPVTLTCGS